MHMRIVTPVVMLLFALPCMAEMKSVQVKEGPLRASASFLGAVVGSVSYGDRVDAGTERNGWTQVKTAAGASGWIHSSALTKKRIVLKGAGEDISQGASTEEIALAGKGFNEQVEREYKSTHNVNFGPVDRMEARSVSEAQVRKFAAEGGLGGGAVR